MEESTLDIGTKASSMEKGSTSMLKEKRSMASGNTERESDGLITE